jgi:perosamine synthetase
MSDANPPMPPLAQPNVGELELALVSEVLASGRLSIGPMVEAFESAVAGIVGVRHAIACSSGTAGLHLAVRATGIGEGDEVITTPFSFVASANCLLYERAVPVFVDIEEDTLGLDPARVEAAVTPRTVGLLPVHVFGKPCRIRALVDLADARAWRVIEDACEALGARVGGEAAGSFGDIAVFAFYPNKQITAGEGGMVMTNDDALAAAVRSMRNQGRDEDGTWLRHVQLGYNYRLDELSAAVGVAQMQRLAELRIGRSRVAAWYAARLGDVGGLTIPVAEAETEVDWFVYVIRVEDGVSRDRVMERLAEQGIQSRPYFAPIHLQPLYRERFGYQPGDFPITERVAASTLALPFSSVMSEADVDLVCDRLVAAVRGATTR